MPTNPEAQQPIQFNSGEGIYSLPAYQNATSPFEPVSPDQYRALTPQSNLPQTPPANYGAPPYIAQSGVPRATANFYPPGGAYPSVLGGNPDRWNMSSGIQPIDRSAMMNSYSPPGFFGRLFNSIGNLFNGGSTSPPQNGGVSTVNPVNPYYGNMPFAHPMNHTTAMPGYAMAALNNIRARTQI